MPNPFSGESNSLNQEPGQMEKTARALAQQLAQASSDFHAESQSQGIIGKSFDFLKDTLGTSAKDHSSFHPAALWSHLLNNDTSSATINNELQREQQLVNKLNAAAQNHDSVTFSNVYKDLTGTVYDTDGAKTSQLPAAQLFKDYSQSQRNGVEFVTDNAAMLASALCFHSARFGSTAKSLALALGSGSLVGSATKISLKQIDSKYANFKEDLVTGTVDGIAVPLGEVAGGALSKYAGNKLELRVSGGFLNTRIETEGAGFVTRAFSAGLRTGAVNSVFNSLEYPTRDFLNHQKIGTSIGTGQLLEDFALGTATGFAGGLAFGAVAEGLHSPAKIVEQDAMVNRSTVEGNGNVTARGDGAVRTPAADSVPADADAKQAVAAKEVEVSPPVVDELLDRQALMARNRELEHLFAEQPITYSSVARDATSKSHIRAGYVTDTDGSVIPILEKTLGGADGANLISKELKAYQLHNLSPFTNSFPVSVARNGSLIQQRIGKALTDRAVLLDRLTGQTRSVGFLPDASPSFRYYFENHPQFRDQLEQSIVERSIYGDVDLKGDNFVASFKNGKVRVGNTDMEEAFGTDVEPARLKPNLASLRGTELSPFTLQKVESFRSFLQSSTGQTRLSAINVSRPEIDAMAARCEWFLTNKHLPS